MTFDLAHSPTARQSHPFGQQYRSVFSRVFDWSIKANQKAPGNLRAVVATTIATVTSNAGSD